MSTSEVNPDNEQVDSAAEAAILSAQNAEPMLKRMVHVGLWCLGLMAVFAALGVASYEVGQNQRHQQLLYIEQAQSALQSELTAWNNAADLPHEALQRIEPKALKALLQWAKHLTETSPWPWHGRLYLQTTQQYLAQTIETLAQPVSGINESTVALVRAEQQLRLDALPKIHALHQHLQTGQNNTAWVFAVLAAIMGALGLGILWHWRTQKSTLALQRRITVLGRALHTQHQSEWRREGAQTALEGVLNVLTEHNKQQSAQSLAINPSEHGHSMLHLARSFHELSTLGTQAARIALHSEQRNAKAEAQLEELHEHMQELRQDIRTAAQGLRRVGQVSRQLMAQLNADSPTEHGEHPINSNLEKLVSQSQEALKESIEGLVHASQRLQSSQSDAEKLNDWLNANETAWSSLLEQIEQHAQSASEDSQKALGMARQLLAKQPKRLRA